MFVVALQVPLDDLVLPPGELVNFVADDRGTFAKQLVIDWLALRDLDFTVVEGERQESQAAAPVPAGRDEEKWLAVFRRLLKELQSLREQPRGRPASLSHYVVLCIED